MSCQICFNPYDHSFHKPHMLSCPHTFCFQCIKKLNRKYCPTCNKYFKISNLNIALLDFIPEKENDKFKNNLIMKIDELKILKNSCCNKRKAKLYNYKTKLDSIRDYINREISQFINLILHKKNLLMNEIDSIYCLLNEDFLLERNDFNDLINMINKIVSIESDVYSLEELKNLDKDCSIIKSKFKQLEERIDEFKEDFEFSLFDNVSFKDGLIGEIQTNQKKYTNFLRNANISKKNQNYPQSIYYLDKAIQVCPLMTASRKSILHFNKGVSFYYLGKYEEALDNLNIGNNLNPQDFKNNQLKGKIYLKMKAFQEALEYFDKALELNSENVECLFLKGKCLFEQKKFDLALNELNKACEKEPSNIDYSFLTNETKKAISAMDSLNSSNLSEQLSYENETSSDNDNEWKEI